MPRSCVRGAARASGISTASRRLSTDQPLSAWMSARPRGVPWPVHASQASRRARYAPFPPVGTSLKTEGSSVVEQRVEEARTGTEVLVELRDERGPERRHRARAAERMVVDAVADQPTAVGIRVAGDVRHAAPGGGSFVDGGRDARRLLPRRHVVEGADAAARRVPVVVVPDDLVDAVARHREACAAAGEDVRARGGVVDVGHAAGDAVRPAVVARRGADRDAEKSRGA